MKLTEKEKAELLSEIDTDYTGSAFAKIMFSVAFLASVIFILSLPAYIWLDGKIVTKISGTAILVFIICMSLSAMGRSLVKKLLINELEK